ncbi:hypothetical protein [Providencia burhodogranariea]|uniref:Lipoprotein n=1 Tax=Providencia burhodogranariea DSM 19968 TaxID=1141662 RepID=K8X4F5_9GAMM|nr:hypothetical protein OOA_02082 [Providencia burhodogranariea DSM 19968]
MKKTTLLVSFILLTGCGDNKDITTVKEMVTYIDRTITVGNAFDHRQMCQTIDWRTEQDKRNRDIVRYSCEINPLNANDILIQNIDFVRGEFLEHTQKSSDVFSEQNKQVQLSKFYLLNAQKALNELSTTSLPKDYAKMKTELEAYLEQHYQTEHVKHFRFSDDFNIKGEPQFAILQLNADRDYINPYYRIENIEQDPVVIERIKQLKALQQQVIEIFYANNADIDNLSPKGAVCEDRATNLYGQIIFPCSFKYQVKHAFDAILFQQQPYMTVKANLQQALTEYDEARAKLDKKDAAYDELKNDIQQRFSTLAKDSVVTHFEQIVDFSLIKGQAPEIADCYFRLALNNGITIELDDKSCFSLAYQNTFNQAYTDLIQGFYISDIRDKVNAQINEVNAKAQNLR